MVYLQLFYWTLLFYAIIVNIFASPLYI
uniref:Uncharacterized protein n=1 Tax=Arundo donax TaxID=35708 RepID=A0A0A9HNL9_ARUDO